MNEDLKKILGWVLGSVITLFMGLLINIGNGIIAGQEKINSTLTSILVKQEGIERRLIVLEAFKTESEERWKKSEEDIKDFYQTYKLDKK